MVLIACCLLRLQGAQLYKSVFLPAVEVWIDLAWKNPLPLSSCNENNPSASYPNLVLHFFCRWPPSNSPCCQGHEGAAGGASDAERHREHGWPWDSQLWMETDPWWPLCGDDGRELQGSSLLSGTVVCTRLVSQSPDLKVNLSFPLQASPPRSLFPKTVKHSLWLPSLSHTPLRSVIFCPIWPPCTGCCHKPSWATPDLPGWEQLRGQSFHARAASGPIIL